MSVAWVGAGIAAVGAVSQASAAKSAAKGQQAATDAANAEQARQYDNNVALQAPTINAGNIARDNLLYRLGLSPGGTSGTTSVGGIGNPSGAASGPATTYDAIRNELLGQYTRNQNGTTAPAAEQPFTGLTIATDGIGSGGGYGSSGGQYWDDADSSQLARASNNTASSTYVDNEGLEAAIQARLAQQAQAQKDAQAAAAADPKYGSLAREYVPDKFSFTAENFEADPSYQFRLDQGQKALDRQGAASGRFLSGSQLQASSNYNQAAASQEYGNAYNRALQTFGTNEGNRANAFQSNYNNAINPLLALSGAATLGSQNLGSAGMSSANAIGSNLTNNANAQGAAGISTANNIANTGNNLVQNYQSNQLLNGLLNNRGVNNNPTIGSVNGYGNTFLQNGYSANQSYG